MPALAYDNDTHYVLTYYLARKVGFSMEQARQIASADVSVDVEPMTEPQQIGQVLNPLGDAQTPRWLFHAFPDSRVFDKILGQDLVAANGLPVVMTAAARKAWDEAIAQRDERQRVLRKRGYYSGNPGQYLHFYQDTFSHATYWTRIGHTAAGHAPDFISNDLRTARKMALGTIDELKRFMHSCMGREPLDPDVADVERVLNQLAAINPVNTLDNLVFRYNVGGRGVPNWEAVAAAISGELGEVMPDWIQYHYPADGYGLDDNWRVEGCSENQKEDELRIKVVDASSQRALDGAQVVVKVPGVQETSASGVTSDGLLDVRLVGHNLSYRVDASKPGYDPGSTLIKFGCDGCEAIAVLALKRSSGANDAEFERNRAALEADLRQRVRRLMSLPQDTARKFDQALQTVQGLVAQREAQRARSQPTAGSAALRNLSSELAPAPALCAQVNAATARLGTTLAQISDHEKDLEQQLRQAQRLASACVDAQALASAQGLLRQGATLGTTIDQQATSLALLAVQVDDLNAQRQRLLLRRTQAAASLGASTAPADRTMATTPPIDFSQLQAALDELKLWNTEWAITKADELHGLFQPFRRQSQELVPSPRINAAMAQFNTLIAPLAGAALNDAAWQQKASLVESLRLRAGAAAQPMPGTGTGTGNAQDASALAAALQGAACLDQPAPDMRAGMAQADTTRATAQLALAKLGNSAEVQVQVCKAQLSGKPLDKQALVAQKVCSYPGSEAVWGDKENRPMCRCIAGSKWNTDQSECIAINKTAEVAAKVCSYAGSEAMWSDKDNRAMCRCKSGSKWNEAQTACVPDQQAQMAALDCSRWQGSGPSWDATANKARCNCPKGTRFDAIFQSCEIDQQARIDALDCSRWPGSVAGWDPTANKARCDCPKGTRYDSITQSCDVDREAQIAATDCSRWPNSIATWDAPLNRPRCSCREGTRYDNASEACEPDRDKLVAQLDCSRYPNSVAYWDEGKERALCHCRPGFHANAARNGCEALAMTPPPPVPANRGTGQSPLVGKWLCDTVRNGVSYRRLFAGDPLERYDLNNVRDHGDVEILQDSNGLYLAGSQRTPKIYLQAQDARHFSTQTEWPGVNRVSYRLELRADDSLWAMVRFVSLNTPSDYTTAYNACKRATPGASVRAGGA